MILDVDVWCVLLAQCACSGDTDIERLQTVNKLRPRFSLVGLHFTSRNFQVPQSGGKIEFWQNFCHGHVTKLSH